MNRSCNNSPRFGDNYLIIATFNENKFFEIRAALGSTKISLCSLREFSGLPEAPETGDSFAENAKQKAEYYFQRLQHSLLAEDSGLVIPALEGFPGVYSSRVANDDAARIAIVLEKLRDQRDRSAHYVCNMVLRMEEGIRQAEGTCKGYITQTPEGGQGFGYDPIFYSVEAGKTFGNMTIKEKSNYSHRARAVQKLIPFIQRELKG